MDTRTIVLCAALAQVMNALLMLWLAFLHHDRVRGVRWWAGAAACLAGGFGLLITRGVLPDLLAIVVANGLIACSMLAYWVGVRSFRRRALRMPLGLAAAGSVTAALAMWTYVVPSISARIVLMGIYGSVVCTGILAELYHIGRRQGHASVALLTSSFVLLALMLSARTVLTVAGIEVLDRLFQASRVQPVFFMSVMLITAMITFGFTVLASSTLQADLHRLAHRDDLTGLSNRRAFRLQATAEIGRSLRNAMPLSLLVLDLDHFKKVNDRLGHHVGDEVLKHTARTMQRILRMHDLCARLGGEEFAIVLPETGLENAVLVADRIRRAMEGQPCRVGSAEVPVTVSAGVVVLSPERRALEDLVQKADELMYRAKSEGRNRVVSDLVLAAESPATLNSQPGATARGPQRAN